MTETTLPDETYIDMTDCHTVVDKPNRWIALLKVSFGLLGIVILLPIIIMLLLTLIAIITA